MISSLLYLSCTFIYTPTAANPFLYPAFCSPSSTWTLYCSMSRNLTIIFFPLQGGYFIFTSNEDCHFSRSGFSQDRIVECHGSLHSLQCSVTVQHGTWRAAGPVAKVYADHLFGVVLKYLLGTFSIGNCGYTCACKYICIYVYMSIERERERERERSKFFVLSFSQVVYDSLEHHAEPGSLPRCRAHRCAHS